MTPLFFVFLTVSLNSAPFDLDPSINKSSLNFTRDNYVEPQQEEPSATTDDPAHDIDPMGPWMICEITAEGLTNINKRTLTKNIAAKDGHLYYKNSIQDDVTALMALGNFENIDVDISLTDGTKKNKEDKADKEAYQCHKLTLMVKEKPIFTKITYKNRKALSKSAIQSAMALKINDPFSKSKLQDDMAKIQSAYTEKGYTNTKATFETEFDPEKNTIKATIILEEGKRTRVKEVVVEGLEKIENKAFFKQLSNRAGKVYKVQKMPEDNYKATIFARNEGYYDFEITDYETVFSEDNSEVTLKYTVKEGHKVIFGDAAFNGNTVYTSQELANLVFFKKGQKFNQQKFDVTVRDIQEAYANKGYLRAEVNPVKKLNEETSQLNVEFDITENNIVFVDHIDITGNESTKTYVFARELTIKEGDIFDYSKIRRGQSKLMNLGFVNDAQIDITPTNDISKVDVGYNIIEGRPGMFTAGIAMSSLDGLYGDVSINHLNLFGKAQRLSLRAMFGSKILDYTVSWTTPWIGDSPTSLTLDAFNTRRYRSYRSANSAYTEKRKGGRVSVSPRFNDDKYILGFSYKFENIAISEIKDEFKTELQEGTTNVSTLGVNFAIDTRDNFWDPTSGARNSLGVELSGGPMFGELDIYQINLKSSYNKTLVNIGKDYPIVLMIGNRVGIVKSYGDTNSVPAYERIFLGGADTVRGYETTGQIGPATGGELYYIGNAELKFPLAREGRRTIAQIAAFFDIGNAWNEFDEIKLKAGSGVGDFKMGIGLGLRLVTPSLPIRLDWGYGLNHKPGEKKSYIYFSVANLF